MDRHHLSRYSDNKPAIPLAELRHRLAGLRPFDDRGVIYRSAARPGAKHLGGALRHDRLRGDISAGIYRRFYQGNPLLLATDRLLFRGDWVGAVIFVPQVYPAIGKDSLISWRKAPSLTVFCQ